MATATSPARLITRTNTRSRYRYLTFSLRGLFALTAICAAGLSWWVVPYKVEYEQAGLNVVGSVRWMILDTDPDPSFKIYRREARTMRRAFPGNPLRHGKTQIYDRQSNLVLEENWRFDKRYGPYSGWDADGILIVQGVNGNTKVDGRWITEHWEGKPPRLRDETEYRNGLPAGNWKHYRNGLLVSEKEFQSGVLMLEAKFDHDAQGNVVRVVERHRNQAHTQGLEIHWSGNRERKDEETAFVTVSHAGSTVRSRFEHVSGRVLYQEPYWERDTRHGAARGWHESGNLRYQGAWLEGRPDGPWRFWSAEGRLLRALDFERGALVRADGRTTDDFTARFRFFGPSRFNTLVSVDLQNVALTDVAAWLREQMPEIEVGFRRETLDSQERFSLQARDIPLRAAIFLLLEPHTLIAVDRYEKLWLTMRDDTWARHEPTGVEALEPDRQSRVGLNLDEPTTLEFIDTPLEHVAEYLSDLHGCSIRLDDELEQAIKDGYRPVITAIRRGHTLRSALGEILLQLDLTCELREDANYLDPGIDAIFICRKKKAIPRVEFVR